MDSWPARIGPDGGIVIPAPFLGALGLVATYVRKGRSLSRELLEERRRGL